MRVLLLHSDVPADAPPDERDTLIQVEAIDAALRARGHEISRAAFTPTLERLKQVLGAQRPDCVFNLVESVEGSGAAAPLAPDMLQRLGATFTGCSARAMAACGNKPLAKQRFRDAGLPTPSWSEPPDWKDLKSNLRYIVKATDEDASLGLDDAAVVMGDAVPARAAACAREFGGSWFAEAYVEGREFNVAVLEEDGSPRVLPMAEMLFEDWPAASPRIVGYAAKWDDGSHAATHTVRHFGVEAREPQLAQSLQHLARKAWSLFELSGYARVDFRIDEKGAPMLLEVNPNPGLAPDAGFAAAAEQAGYSYAETMERILRAARSG